MSNDDVAMSMVAHGYGIAAIGLPNLVFSNVLWGYLVRAIPEINGVLGYSIATLTVLVIVGTVVIYSLYQLSVNYITCLLIFALIMVRPVLFPQFTVNSGLLVVGAIICWHLYAQRHDKRVLLVGCFLAFCSYLVRSQEFLLVLIVALPLLSWRILLLDRSAKIAFLALIAAIAVSATIDHQAYQGDEWKAFNELNLARAAFTDFGAGTYLKQHPDILQRYNYSNNDVDLIANWFFVDSKIANPQTLRNMLTELGFLPAQGNTLAKAWLGLRMLWHPDLLPLILATLLLFILRPNWQIAASWGLFIAAVFTLGLLGRPGVLRVYIPLVCLLLIAPFLVNQVSVWHNRLRVCILLMATAINVTYAFSESKAFQIAANQTRKSLVNFPSDSVIIWGAEFPFEANYPVLDVSSHITPYKLYGLGVFTLAPFSRPFADQQAGRGMTDLLVKETGVFIVAAAPYFKYLEIYCQEHFHGQIKELSTKQYDSIVVNQQRCEIKP